ncbi:MAG: flagellar motor protein MotB [Lachnospiraceae bacterium]|nr:flagellar motor protein MotB [Lachnospiraceae bacterium]
MARRKKEEPQKASAEWMNTFADLMNLLLCFFVLLFAMSTVDAQKFEMVVASFSQTFSIFSGGQTSIGKGMLLGNGVSQLNELDQYMESMGKTAENEEETDQIDEMQKKIEEAQLEESEKLAERIEEAIEESQMEDMIQLDFTSQYVQLTLKGAILFDSGSAALKEDAMPVIEKVALILERYAESEIEIEGHTDNVPIHTSKYANNNELSSSRALSMFDYLIEHTALEPAKIKHSGRGEYLPIADNTTPEGRAKNRRIEIKIYNELSGE